METYGRILNMAMPIFLILVLFEKWYGWKKGFETVRTMDMLSSLSSGVTNVVKDVLGLSIAIISYQWLVNKVAIFHVDSGIWTYVIAFIALDFSGYWVHRLSHEINFFWNKHAVHHSSEEFNLACALRQSISEFVRIFTVFLLPAAIFGVPAEVIAVVGPIQLFAQFWYHTRHIDKMGFLEKIIVTPSHHRVHHAINPIYLDRNHSQIFIIWDKLFGTFQEELPDVPPVYGITRPVSTWNPIKINFLHLWLLIKDAWRTENWKDKARIWFMPTGWRPADVEAKYPVQKIEDIYHFDKYNPKSDAKLAFWSCTQLLVTFALVMYFFANIAQIGSPNMFFYGAFIFLSVYSYTELMDRNQYAVLWELIRFLFGIYLIQSMGDWFGASAKFPYATYFVAFYLGLSLAVAAFFVFIDFKNEKVFSY